MARAKTSSTDSLKVGDHVASNVPGFNWKGIVVEDHGPLGLDGSQIVLVRVDYGEVSRQFDVPAKNVDRLPATGAERQFDVVTVAESDGGYSVFVPELPSVAAQGETIEEARTNAREAIEAYLEVMHADGLPIPEVHRDRIAVRSA
jgi:antitoxin HicB